MGILDWFSMSIHKLIIWSTAHDELMMMGWLWDVFHPAHCNIPTIDLGYIERIKWPLCKVVWYWRTSVPLNFGGWVWTPYFTRYEVRAAYGKWLQWALNFGTLWWNWNVERISFISNFTNSTFFIFKFIIGVMKPFLYLQSILSATLLSTGLVILLLEAKHLNFPTVCFLSNLLIVNPFFTVPSNVCWYESSITSSSRYHKTSGNGSPKI